MATNSLMPPFVSAAPGISDALYQRRRISAITASGRDAGELGRVALGTRRAVLSKPYDLSAAAERIRQMLSHR